MEIYRNFPLSEILNYKLGGKAKYVLSISTEEDVVAALEFIHKKSITNILPVGLGTNLLVSDKDFDGAVLWFQTSRDDAIALEGTTVHAFAGVVLDTLIHYTFTHNLIGLEWAGGLPSTVGAAVRGNVGCFGKEIKDIVVSATVIDSASYPFIKRVLTKDELALSYRTSSIKQNPSLLVTSVSFAFANASTEQLQEARKTYEQNILYRKEHHPIEYPSCGSVFKNITRKEDVEKILAVWPDVKEQVITKWHNKIAMGYVINRLGLTGVQEGHAQISKKHSNYIVNLGGASFDDVYTLIRRIQDSFYKTFDFLPEPEVQIIA